MKTVGLILLLLFQGPGLLSIGIWSIRNRGWRDSVPALELMLDHAAGIEPPPRTKWDQRFAHFQAWFFIVIGSFFSLGLIAVLYSDFSE